MSSIKALSSGVPKPPQTAGSTQLSAGMEFGIWRLLGLQEEFPKGKELN